MLKPPPPPNKKKVKKGKKKEMHLQHLPFIQLLISNHDKENHFLSNIYFLLSV